MIGGVWSSCGLHCNNANLLFERLDDAQTLHAPGRPRKPSRKISRSLSQRQNVKQVMALDGRSFMSWLRQKITTFASASARTDDNPARIIRQDAKTNSRLKYFCLTNLKVIDQGVGKAKGRSRVHNLPFGLPNAGLSCGICHIHPPAVADYPYMALCAGD